MKILITGATGFIGKSVLKKLLKRYAESDMIIISGAPNIEIGKIRYVPSLDYNFDADYMCKMNVDVDVIVHIGAFTPKSGNDVNEITKSTSNIQTTEKLLSAASYCHNLKKFIFISTLDVYAGTDEILSENTLTLPQTMYGWSKLYCEQMVKTFSKQHKVCYEILRLGHVYGEGEENYHKAIPVMIRNAICGRDISIYGDGKALRTFIYIEDAAEAIVNSVIYETSDVINIVGNEAVSIYELAEKIIKLTGRKSSVIHIPTEIYNKNLVFENRKLMNTLLSSFTPLEDGLKREINYMRKGM